MRVGRAGAIASASSKKRMEAYKEKDIEMSGGDYDYEGKIL
jgi:hypothetical protein